MQFRYDSSDLDDMAEINVTPLVDVMLVLLIIFMVTAPMLTQGLTVALRARRVKRALLEADKAVPYGRVVAVLDVMNRAGVEQLGMVTQPREIDARRRR